MDTSNASHYIIKPLFNFDNVTSTNSKDHTENNDVLIIRRVTSTLLSFNSNTIAEIANITVTGGNDPYANRQAFISSGKLTVRDCLFTNGTGGGFGEYITITGDGTGYIYDSNFT